MPDLCKGRESHAVEVVVVLEVNKHLSGAGVLARSRKRHHAPRVLLFDRVVLHGLGLPLRRDLGVGMDPKLGHEAVDDTEESIRLEEVGIDELLETSRPERGPVWMHLTTVTW